MRSHLLKSFVALIVFGALLALASPTSAQWGRPDRFERGYAGRLIRDAENRSDQFVAVFDRALDMRGMEGTVRAERLNDRARDLESALNRVRQAFEQRSGNEEIRSELANAINIAEGINRVM